MQVHSVSIDLLAEGFENPPQWEPWELGRLEDRTHDVDLGAPCWCPQGRQAWQMADWLWCHGRQKGGNIKQHQAASKQGGKFGLTTWNNTCFSVYIYTYIHETMVTFNGHQKHHLMTSNHRIVLISQFHLGQLQDRTWGETCNRNPGSFDKTEQCMVRSKKSIFWHGFDGFWEYSHMINFRDVNRIAHFESLLLLCFFFFGDAHAACASGMAKQGPVQAQDWTDWTEPVMQGMQCDPSRPCACCAHVVMANCCLAAVATAFSEYGSEIVETVRDTFQVVFLKKTASLWTSLTPSFKIFQDLKESWSFCSFAPHHCSQVARRWDKRQVQSREALESLAFRLAEDASHSDAVPITLISAAANSRMSFWWLAKNLSRDEDLET